MVQSEGGHVEPGTLHPRRRAGLRMIRLAMRPAKSAFEPADGLAQDMAVCAPAHHRCRNWWGSSLACRVTLPPATSGRTKTTAGDESPVQCGKEIEEAQPGRKVDEAAEIPDQPRCRDFPLPMENTHLVTARPFAEGPVSVRRNGQSRVV